MHRSPNPLLAELSAPRAASGLFSARLNLDFALSAPRRVFWRLGYLTEGEAMRAGRRLAEAIGRSVIRAPGAVAPATIPADLEAGAEPGEPADLERAEPADLEEGARAEPGAVAPGAEAWSAPL